MNEMTCHVSVEEIQRDVVGWLRRVEAGETVVVVRAETPVVELRPVAPAPTPRPVGLCQGEFIVPADFDAPLPESVLAEFEG
jgi:antitoxin (DNA-binding transcriptional repressor) of toxin-antitoxin stability system